MTDPWQARASELHPYLVDSLAGLPDSLRSAAQAALPAGAQLTSALVVPADYSSDAERESYFVPEQALVFTDSGILHVQAGQAEGAAPSTLLLNPADCLWLRSSHLLLYGRLEMVCAVQREAARLDMEFNAIGWPLMGAAWRDLVGRTVGLPAIAAGEEKSESEAEKQILQQQPAKFADGLRRYALYTGETLLGAVFQPEVWVRTAGVFEQQTIPDTLIALTTASVLVLAEEPALVRHSDELGLIIARIPRQAITGVRSAEQEAQPELCFDLARSGATADYRLQLEPSALQAWLELWAQHSAGAR